MRRALALCLVSVPANAFASPWSITAEAGAEYDTNVERVENGTTDANMQPIDPITAGVSRFGGRVDHKDKLLGGTYVIDTSALVRIVAVSSQPTASVADPAQANVATLTADARWLHPIGDRPVSVGVAGTAADAIGLCGSDCIGDRTFDNVGIDAIVAMRDEHDRHLTLAVGLHDFEYKPAPEFSWTGPTANARLDVVLAQSDDHTRSVELTTTAGVDVRTYNDFALVVAGCPMGSPAGDQCTAATTFTRRDRYEHVGAELTMVGRRIFAIGYQLGVSESNSFGQSLIRNRVTASTTSELPWGLFGTVLATLQIDQYPDGLVVLNPETAQFRNLEDESRSSLQVRLSRHVNDEWSIEARAAVWRNIGDTQDNDFHRTLVSLGVVYSQ